MSSNIAVAIPTLNEEASLERAIRSVHAGGITEVVVGDGGSSDRTLEVAARCGARVVTSTRMRAIQMNEAARSSAADIIIFLHADTSLPPDAGILVREAVANGFGFGGFRLRFAESALRLRIAARMINLRTSITHCPWGDQAQFMTRERFREVAGYREIAIMEDYDLARRMKALGPVALLRSEVETSARRFLERGVLATAITNWRIVASYHLGASPDDLRRLYGSR